MDPQASNQLRARLKIFTGTKFYFCQASELLKATKPLSRWDRLGKCVDEVRAGNCSAFEMAHRIAIWLYWRTRPIFVGEYARGHNGSTPATSLNLQPGEWIKVEPMEQSRKTVNETGHNRGLYLSPDMRLLCGKHLKVARRLDKIIVDRTGEMR